MSTPSSSSQPKPASSQPGERVDAKRGGSMDVEPADRERFEALADRWREETFFLSRSDLKNAHPALQEIISMGPPMVPLILERMRYQGGHWFEALQTANRRGSGIASRLRQDCSDAEFPGCNGANAMATSRWLTWLNVRTSD